MHYILYTLLVCSALTISSMVLAGPIFEDKDGQWKTQIDVQLQPQYQFLAIEGTGDTNSLQIRRGRIIFKGYAFTEDLTYKFQFEAVGGRTSNASPGVAYTGPNLRDAYLNYAVLDAFQIKAGQFKPYYNREELTSSSELQFVDRSLTNEVFSFNRDLAVAIHGLAWKKRFEYAFFGANEGTNQNTQNNNKMFLVGGRFVYNVLGHHGYTFSDVDYSEFPHLAWGLAANYNKIGAPTAADNSVFAVTTSRPQ